MTDYCGRGDIDYLQKQHLRIDADKVISEVDSSFTFLMDSGYFKILDMTEIKVSETRYYLDREGAIIEIKKPD